TSDMRCAIKEAAICAYVVPMTCGGGGEATLNLSDNEGGEPLQQITFYRSEVLRARLTAWLDVSRAGLRLTAPVVDLLIRLSLAKAFFAPGMLPGSNVADFRSTWLMIIAQITGPLLLAVGFWVRPVALLMLILTLLARSVGAPQDEHLFW